MVGFNVSLGAGGLNDFVGKSGVAPWLEGHENLITCMGAGTFLPMGICEKDNTALKGLIGGLWKLYAWGANRREAQTVGGNQRKRRGKLLKGCSGAMGSWWLGAEKRGVGFKPKVGRG